MIPLNLRVPADVREHLQAWADRNITSMTAELVRSIRERAEREQGRKAGTTTANGQVTIDT